MKEQFIIQNFKERSLGLLSQCNEVIQIYQLQGLRLSLRQLYYQLVTRNIIANAERQYKNLGHLVSQGRLAGFIDWDAIEDRMRIPHKITEWASPSEIIHAAIAGYRLPRWDSQEYYVELWCEKDALAGVLQPISDEYHVTMIINRGYSSQSAMKSAAERLLLADENGKLTAILYIGDQDPSGEDMVRDVQDRLDLLTRGMSFDVKKIAITEEQVTTYTPPPNPAKLSDPRARSYIDRFGNSSYEADALPPDVLAGIVRDSISSYVDSDAWDSVTRQEEVDKKLLRDAADYLDRHKDDQGEE